MTGLHDDPRLTAYALGELPPEERRAVAGELRGDRELLGEIDAIQKLAAELEGELGQEPLPALDADARAAIERRARGSDRVPVLDAAHEERPAAGRLLPFRRGVPAPLLAAAGLLGAVGLGALTLMTGKRAMRAEVAYAPAPAAMDPAYDRADRDAELAERARADANAPEAMARVDPQRQAEFEQRRMAYQRRIEAQEERERRELEAQQPGVQPAAGEPRPDMARTQLEQGPVAEPADPRANGPLPPANTNAGKKEAETKSLTLGAQPGLKDRGGRVGPGAPQRPPVDGTRPDAPRPDTRGFTELRPGERRPDEQRHADVVENPFRSVRANPLSTFGSDVDTASYVAVRNYLRHHTRVPAGAVRLEEMVNYFPYGDAPPAPEADTPFAVHAELAGCPWAPEHQLLRVAIKGKEISAAERPPSNLVFLLDVSGSMSLPNKLPLLKRAFRLLVERLDERDHVAIVVYAGASGVVLPSTSGDRHEEILRALDGLRASGGTHGAAGLELAYQLAVGSFAEGGVNRVILATDGDFNVGPTSQRALTELIQDKAKSGVFLTVLGFGMSPNDRRLENLANRGNGTYAFVDDDREARKVMVEEMTGTLVTIAKDLKLQVEFNPRRVGSYRLLGYENRVLAARDFNDDKKDAGEVGAGHTVTAFYELVPPGKEEVDPLKYQPQGASDDVCTVRVRFKRPDKDQSELREVPVAVSARRADDASEAFRFGAAVVSFGMILRDSPHKGQSSLPLVRELAQGALGADPQGRRKELVELIDRARELYRR
ncbi:MAG: von Willebrand factor type A domain-containing protein [Planctomycetota bacterium]